MTRVEFQAAWEDAFWRRVDRRADDECWPWKGSLTTAGRATWHVGGRKGQRVFPYRFSFWLANGPFDLALAICHRCDNPRCVNPAHLFAGTQAQNLQDMTAKGRRSRCGASGERNANHKVTDEQAVEIARRRDAGERPSDLALEFGLNRTSIYKIIARACR